jgi:hypothetical protein
MDQCSLISNTGRKKHFFVCKMFQPHESQTLKLTNTPMDDIKEYSLVIAV